MKKSILNIAVTTATAITIAACSSGGSDGVATVVEAGHQIIA